MPATLRIPRRNKYRATPIVVYGQRFASKHEYEVWRDLQLREGAGDISELRRQVPIPLYACATGGPKHVGDLVVDFTYRENGKIVYVDAKGFDKKTQTFRTTDLYNWKKRHATAQGIEILEA